MKTLLINSLCAVSAVLLFSGCQPKLAETPYGAREQAWEEFVKNSYSDWKAPKTVPPETLEGKQQAVLPVKEEAPVFEVEEAEEVVVPVVELEQEPVIETPAPPPAPKSTTYTVKKGETLWMIAKKQYGKGMLWKKIYEANKAVISNPNKVPEGTKIEIPSS